MECLWAGVNSIGVAGGGLIRVGVSRCEVVTIHTGCCWNDYECIIVYGLDRVAMQLWL